MRLVPLFSAGRRFGYLKIAMLALGLSLLMATGSARAGSTLTAFVPADLLAQAQANPAASFSVIVQGTPAHGADAVAKDVFTDVLLNPGVAAGLRRQLATVNGAAAQLTGKQLLQLAKMTGPSVLRRLQAAYAEASARRRSAA